MDAREIKNYPDLSDKFRKLELHWANHGLDSLDSCSIIANFFWDEEGGFCGDLEDHNDPIWICIGLVPMSADQAQSFYDWAITHDIDTLMTIAKGYSQLKSDKPDRYYALNPYDKDNPRLYVDATGRSRCIRCGRLYPRHGGGCKLKEL